MKAGRVILAIVFFVLFIILISLVVKGWRSIDYSSVFPEDVNAVIHIRNPLDVPLKVLESSAARKFFATEQGKQTLEKINAALEAAASGGGGGEPPPMFKTSVEGVNVFYVAKPPESVEEKKEEKKKPAKKLNLDEVKKLMAIGGAVVKGAHIALYGSPMEFSPENPKILVALDLGRMASVPGKVLSGKAKPASKMPEDVKPLAAFAFVRNLVVIGDPEGVERMIHVVHGSSMKTKVTKLDSDGNEVTEEATLNTKPLGKSVLWEKAQKAWQSKDIDFRLTLLIPNLLAHLQSDMMFKDQIASLNDQYGLDKLLAFSLSTGTGVSGLKLRIALVAEEGNPVIKVLDQPEVEMKWPDMLPDGFMVGAGMNVGNYTDLYNGAAQLAGGEAALAPLAGAVGKVFGVSDVKEFLANLNGEISMFQFKAGENKHMVFCLGVGPGMSNWLESAEGSVADEEIAKAEKKVDAAKAGNAEANSPALFETAVEELENARNALEDGLPVEAVVCARKAGELADASLMALYKKAESVIENATARSFRFGYTQETSDAQTLLDEASRKYSSGAAAEGTELSAKAFDMGRAALALTQAAEFIEKAREAGADSKASANYAAAKAALAQAGSSWKAKNYSAANTQAQLATSMARQAIAHATGGPAPEPESMLETPDSPDTELPPSESPRVVHNKEVMLTVGEGRMSYTFADDNTVCLAKAEDIEAYLGLPTGNTFKNEKMRELFKNIPREVQALAVQDIYAIVNAEGLTAMLDEEMGALVEGLNLTGGTFIETNSTGIAITSVLPVKLFDGSTGGGSRSTASLVILALRLLLYLFTILFLYLTIKLLTPKKTI